MSTKKKRKEEEAARGRILKKIKRERSGLRPHIEKIPLSFGKKKVEQRKPVWGSRPVAFAAACAP